MGWVFSKKPGFLTTLTTIDLTAPLGLDEVSAQSSDSSQNKFTSIIEKFVITMSAKIDAVQLQFSGHQYVAVQSMRTAGSPNANVVVPNQSKQPPPAVILTLTLISTLSLTLALILIKTTNPTQQKGRRNNCLFIKFIFFANKFCIHYKSTVFSCFILLSMFLACNSQNTRVRSTHQLVSDILVSAKLQFIRMKY